MWSYAPILPTSLVDLLDIGDQVTEDEIHEEEDEDIYDFESYGDSDTE